jgi:hypothetical protein
VDQVLFTVAVAAGESFQVTPVGLELVVLAVEEMAQPAQMLHLTVTGMEATVLPAQVVVAVVVMREVQAVLAVLELSSFVTPSVLLVRQQLLRSQDLQTS